MIVARVQCKCGKVEELRFAHAYSVSSDIRVAAEVVADRHETAQRQPRKHDTTVTYTEG